MIGWITSNNPSDGLNVLMLFLALYLAWIAYGSIKNLNNSSGGYKFNLAQRGAAFVCYLCIFLAVLILLFGQIGFYITLAVFAILILVQIFVSLMHM